MYIAKYLVLYYVSSNKKVCQNVSLNTFIRTGQLAFGNHLGKILSLHNYSFPRKNKNA